MTSHKIRNERLFEFLKKKSCSLGLIGELRKCKIFSRFLECSEKIRLIISYCKWKATELRNVEL